MGTRSVQRFGVGLLVPALLALSVGTLGLLLGPAAGPTPSPGVVSSGPAAPSPFALPPAVRPASGAPASSLPHLANELANLRTPAAAKVGGKVVDAIGGGSFAVGDADALLTPASSLKLLTAVMALDLLGPDHRFVTQVVAPAAGQLILVGGGDPYLTSQRDAEFEQRASIPELADRTAAALKARGTTVVQLGYDATLFSGPAWNPGWVPDYLDQVSPTAALWVDEGISTSGARAADPARQAATAFATALAERGVTVSAVTAQAAPAGATLLAEVSSLALDSIVEQVLLHSDNSAAEVLFRHAAIAAGGAGSIADAQRLLPARAQALGLWVEGMRFVDGSGLAFDNRATAAVLAKAVTKGLDEARFRALITGMPTAGGTGTLRFRFDDSAAAEARGSVRAKTGTLTGVHALAGYVLHPNGERLVFALLVNGASDDAAARLWLERATALLAAEA